MIAAEILTPTHTLSSTPPLAPTSPLSSTPKTDNNFPVVSKIAAAIEARPGRDSAASESQARAIVKSLAEENGFHNLWTPEERAIGAALERLSCGPRSAHFGWRLYRRYRQSGTIGVEAVSY